MKKIDKSFLVLTLALASSLSLGLPAKADTLADPQIAQIMREANDAEISAGKLAKSHAQNADVKKFAEHMVTEHTENNKEGKDLGKKLNVKPTKSENSMAIKKDGEAKEKELKSAKKADFDKAYIDSQIAMHSALMKDLTSTYIPQATNPEMKTFLEETKTHVQEHLAEAQKIQATLPNTGASVTK